MVELSSERTPAKQISLLIQTVQYFIKILWGLNNLSVQILFITWLMESNLCQIDKKSSTNFQLLIAGSFRVRSKLGGPVYHNIVEGALKIHLGSSHTRHVLRLVVNRVLSPVLAQGSTATGSLTRRVKPERLTRQNGNDN